MQLKNNFKLNEKPDAVQIVGDHTAGKYFNRFLLYQAIESQGIARAYAKEQLNTLDLLEDKQQIIKLAIEHGLMTPFTSFIAIEESFSEVAKKSFEAPNMAVKGSVMPQTSGNNDSLMFAGILLLMLGLLVIVCNKKNEC